MITGRTVTGLRKVILFVDVVDVESVESGNPLSPAACPRSGISPGNDVIGIVIMRCDTSGLLTAGTLAT